MASIIRAEDFDLGDGIIMLGVRKLRKSSILSFHIDRRVSPECLGFCILFLFCLGILIFGGSAKLPMTPVIASLLLGTFAGFGIRRELQYPYVLVLEAYQMGHFEVRGFDFEDAKALDILLDEMMTSGN